MTRILIPIGLALALAGCGPGTKLSSIAGGECQLPSVHTPPIAVAGKTQYDQDWIDDTTEGLVRACNQPRPQPRPPELDKLPAPKHTVQPVKKKTWVAKLKRTPTPLPPLKPVAPIEPPVTPPPPAPKGWWEYLKR